MNKFNKNKTLIFISNSFGYGPTSTTIAVLPEVLKIWKGKIIFIANRNNKNLINNPRIKIKVLDDRNENILESYIKSIINPYVFSCMNRFIINPARRNAIPIVFLDTLSWFWKEAPSNYLKADYYFYQKIPFLKNSRDFKKYKNVIEVSPIIGKMPKSNIKQLSEVLISIGGGSNPLTNSISKNYLDLLDIFLMSVDKKIRLLVVGGEESIKYLKSKVKKENIRFNTLDWNNAMKNLINSKRILTTAGLKTTFESFYLNKKLSYLLPMNKSQWKLEDEIKRLYPKIYAMRWEEYLSIAKDFEELSEKEAILYLEQKARDLLKNEKKLKLAIEDFNSLMTKNQPSFYKGKFGFQTDGSIEIAEILEKIWDLNAESV